jgi:acyl phosphate:glycerol-3-phosphate acyltransferase
MKTLFLICIGAYLAGSINFAILVFKIRGKKDPRNGFSGNPGVANVYRHSGYLWAVMVLLLDVGRAVAIALIASYLLPIWLVPWAGLGLILGNRLPCFHNLRGGKGVANYLGFTLVVAPLGAGLSTLGWLLTYALSRIPFIGSFVMVFILGAGTIAACGYDPAAITGVAVTVALIFYNHKPNVLGLLRKSKSAEPPKA